MTSTTEGPFEIDIVASVASLPELGVEVVASRACFLATDQNPLYQQSFHLKVETVVLHFKGVFNYGMFISTY